MIYRYPKAADSGTETKTAPPAEGPAKEDACRCKETAEMTPRQLIGLMLSDLAFWKKAKRG